MRTKVEQASIHWEAASAAAAGAVHQAEALGVSVNVAVVGQGGHLVAFLAMPGAAYQSAEIAMDKARTAMSFGFPTSKWAEQLAALSTGARAGLSSRRHLALFGGGAPIEIDGTRIGAVGVSGASELQDEECAAAGVAAVSK